MEKMRRFWAQCKDNSAKIFFVLGVCFSFFVIGFPLVSELIAPLQLTGFEKNTITTLIDIFIFIPLCVFIGLQVSYLILTIIKIRNQSKTNSRSVWSHFLSFISNNVLIFALVLIYVLFYRFWETWIGNHIIEPFLCHFESNLQNDFIFIIATITCIVIIYVKIVCLLRGILIKRVNQHTLIVSIIAIVFWALYRFNHGLCGMTDSAYYMGFTSLSIFKPIKYFDFVLVFAFFKYISYVFWKYQDAFYFSFIRFWDRGSEGLTRNLPIYNETDDLLERNGFAKSVMKELWDTNTGSSSFTCGIDAPWGSGKTSFINLMKNHLESDEFKYINKIIIDFNPWLYAAEKDLVSAFFDELSKTLKQYDNSLAKNLIHYSKLLSALDTTETKLISSLLELTQYDDSSLQDKKKQISEAIKRIKRKIFVFIDDLDRLEANEILEMMKLIRNVSDFPYMYIIAAYDKSYVTRCLSTKMKLGANNFIEKIFEHEHILTPCSNESLRRALADELRKINAGDFLKPEYEDYILDHKNKALDALSNLREIYRLSNNIASTYSILKQEYVNGIDLLLLGLFKTKYPVAFSLFEHKWHEILIKVAHDKYQYYELFQGVDKDGYFDLIRYLNIHKKEMSMNEFDIKTIKTILSELFMLQKNVDDTHRINDVRWFNRYLNLTQLKSDIPEKEFNEVLNQSIDEIKKNIDDWSVNKSVSLIYRLFNYCKANQLNREQLVNNIQAVFYASIKYDWTIYDEINNVITLLKRFNNGIFSKEDQTFILGQLKDNGCSSFMCKYVGYLYRQKKYLELSLFESELIEAQQCIFNDCCKNMGITSILDAFIQLLDRKTNDLYHNQEFMPNDNYEKRLIKSMQDYAKEHIEIFLESIIDQHNRYHNWYDIHPITKVIWGSWKQFSDYLSKINDSNPVIIEFKAFYKKFKKGLYQPVPFDFKTIKPGQ